MEGKRQGIVTWLRGGKREAAAGGADRKARLGKGSPLVALADRLEDLGEIGRGSMASVRLVRDRNLLRRVAMKVLLPEVAEHKGEIGRFLEEAQITGQLDHPNIPPVYEVGLDEDGTHFFAMKHVQGVNLDQVIKSEGFSIRDHRQLFRVLQIFVDVCQAVAFAHSRGVVHCDLKPSNVMVGSHGQVYVMDWGIARLSSEARPSGADARDRVELGTKQARGRDDGMVLGSLSFMSPEQAQGRNAELDGRSDIFSLGAVLYCLLTGQPPYRAATAEELIEKASQAGWTPFAEAAPGVALPRRLCAIAARAMARLPEERYPSIEALQEEIEAFLRGPGRLPTATFAPGALIVREGEPGDAAYVIGAGRCVAFKQVDGRRQVLREMGPGDVFGETAVLTCGPRTASVEALDAVKVAVVTAEALSHEMGETLLLGRLLEALAGRFREVDARVGRLQAERDAAALQGAMLRHLALHGERSGGRVSGRWSGLAASLGKSAAQLEVALPGSGLSLDRARDEVWLAAAPPPPPAPRS